jgi:tol-pal system protein YbgF
MRRASFLMLASLLFLSACATRKEIVDFKKDTSLLRVQLDSLRSSQHDLHFMLDRLQAMAAQAADSDQRLREGMSAKLQHIAEQNQFLSARLEEFSRRLSRLPTQLRSRTPMPSTPPSAGKVNHADTSKSNGRPQFPGSVRLYESAYQDFTKGQHAEAREGFILYLRLLPQGELADDAQYWIGESYYSDGQIEKALQAFQTLVSGYPDSDRMPAAMLKSAECQIALGQTKVGKKTLETLLERFPSAKEAEQARKHLRKLP